MQRLLLWVTCRQAETSKASALMTSRQCLEAQAAVQGPCPGGGQLLVGPPGGASPLKTSLPCQVSTRHQPSTSALPCLPLAEHMSQALAAARLQAAAAFPALQAQHEATHISCWYAKNGHQRVRCCRHMSVILACSSPYSSMVSEISQGSCVAKLAIDRDSEPLYTAGTSKSAKRRAKEKQKTLAHQVRVVNRAQPSHPTRADFPDLSSSR